MKYPNDSQVEEEARKIYDARRRKSENPYTPLWEDLDPLTKTLFLSCARKNLSELPSMEGD